MPSFFLEYIKKRNLEKKRKRRHGKRRHTKRKLEGKWSTLPEDLIQLIAKKLSLTDHFSASKVCKRWNAALREDDPSWQGRGFPCLFVSGELHNPNKSVISILDNLDWKFYEPGASRFYCWGSYLEWLIMVNHEKINWEVEFGNIMFWNPFTRKQVTLPSISFPYHKIVLSGPPSEDGFVCMLLQHHMKDRKLAFYKAGAQSWLEFRLKGEPFEDALFFNGSFYLLDGSCNIWQIDVEGICSVISEDGLSELQMQLHEIDMSDMQPINDMPSDQILRYLVESCGEILLVCRYILDLLVTVKFEVYSLDLALSSWKKVEDLKDQMLFLGRSCSYSLSAEELGAGIRNSIYFTNDRDEPWYRDYDWYEPYNEWDENWQTKALVYVTIKAERNAPVIWGNFEVGNDYGNSFTFSGDLDNWPYTWFIAPIWWYCKKASYPNWSNKWHRY